LKTLLLGVINALMFSAFIYLEYYGYTVKTINTIFGISSLALFLYMPKKAVLISGFLIGIFWFYWIGYSFEYQGVGYIMPFVTFGFGIIYMLFFGVLALSNNVAIRAILIFALSFFEPFDWNWLQIEAIFTDSYIGLFKYNLFIILVALSMCGYMKKKYRYLPLLLIIFSLDFSTPKQYDAPLKIKLVSTDIKQQDKWLRQNLIPTIKLGYKEIQQAIAQHYDIVVLPESFFPLYMNKTPQLLNQLLKLSKKITIITGTLLREDNKNYNVTYMFNDGRYKIAKKVTLVPFGEYIPLPKFAQDFINDTFFSGASDFVAAKKPTDFIIKGVKFRNAICYEATCQELYSGDVKYMIAISNNAWFAPSIEPTLQHILLKFYARKNQVTIYHSANYKGSGVIK